ncbi:MAG: TIGR00282 family metallophosphoesterase [Nitrospirae bacterium]|nr:MAG: TIGR00282 family metallophosphoesterase [Nitrospirota bacterium]
MNILFIGDIVGKPGRRAVKALLPGLRGKLKVDLVVANCENAAGGFGITQKTVDELFSSGIDLMTSGNHIWDKKEALTILPKEDRILRPLNYPPGVPGRGSILYSVNDCKVGVVNLSGRVFMGLMDCPFRAIDEELDRLMANTSVILVDFHAEATSEKLAMAHYLDGRVTALLGTHTHVQTADEQVLPKGTAYITDVGMTGPQMSVIGVKSDIVIEKFLTQMPKKFDTAGGGWMFSAVLVEADEKTGKALSIKRLSIKE